MKQYIEAYIWMYGATKAEAHRAVKNLTQERLDLILKIYIANCKKSFWED